ncbi:hypothetical protein TRIP_B250224 [uncultured Desulfatiglans sp.]|nr:hypothetical protein TRIP_B250224 [uncultured Desulfatiglans sp.]
MKSASSSKECERRMPHRRFQTGAYGSGRGCPGGRAKTSVSLDRFLSRGGVGLIRWGQLRRLRFMAHCLLCRAGDVQEQRIDGGRALRTSKEFNNRRHT